MTAVATNITPSNADYYAAVSRHYTTASSARTKTGTYETTVASAFGYSPSELSSIPADSNLGLSCGNPLALAALRPGETVLDLGCGAGFDVFLASPRVGEKGRAIGVDVNPDMLAKARRNLEGMKSKGNGKNVEFVESEITDMSGSKPASGRVESESVDCVVSNCVINLVPEGDKHLVFEEMYRVLKVGGRVAVSDVLLKQDLPDELKGNMALYVGCIGGASRVEGYEKYLKEAGFRDVLIVDAKRDLNVYNEEVAEGFGGKSCCGVVVDGDDQESKGVNGCGPKKEQQEDMAKSCCGTSVPVAKKSCCGTSSSANDNANRNGTIPSEIDLRTIDFNKYAGSYSIYAVKA